MRNRRSALQNELLRKKDLFPLLAVAHLEWSSGSISRKTGFTLDAGRGLSVRLPTEHDLTKEVFAVKERIRHPPPARFPGGSRECQSLQFSGWGTNCAALLLLLRLFLIPLRLDLRLRRCLVPGTHRANPRHNREKQPTDYRYAKAIHRPPS